MAGNFKVGISSDSLTACGTDDEWNLCHTKVNKTVKFRVSLFIGMVNINKQLISGTVFFLTPREPGEHLMRKIALQLNALVHFILKDWTDEGLSVLFN